eukprot:8626787-Alexandrium_andersonii.AAC.1
MAGRGSPSSSAASDPGLAGCAAAPVGRWSAPGLPSGDGGGLKTRRWPSIHMARGAPPAAYGGPNINSQ